MYRVLFLSVWFLFATLSWPEIATAQEDPDVDVFFLVDASGTMASAQRQSEAESKLTAAFELLDRGTQVSVTFFGGTLDESGDSVTCDDPIEVSRPKPKEDGVPLFPRLGGDDGKTSIGNALLAALRHGEIEAKITLITDGIEECNSDFLSIRTEFPNATIDVVQVGDRPNSALNLLELKPDQFSSIQSLPVPLPIEIIGEEPKPDDRPGLVIFFEKWLWLLTFILVYILSFWLGWSNQNRAIKIESDTQALQSLEKASLIEGNEKAQEELATKLEKITDAREQLETQRDGWSDWKIRRANFLSGLWNPIRRWQITGIILVGCFLFWVAATENEILFSYLQTENVRKSAWTILDSDFATAFAVIWIVSLFYSGMQFQRRKEAETNFSIVSKEAKWKEELANKRALERANRELELEVVRVRRGINRMKFGSWRMYFPDTYGNVDIDSFELNKRFTDIHDAAKRRVLESSELDIKDYSSEIKRLKRYISIDSIPSSGFSTPKQNFRAFLEIMLADETVVSTLTENWRVLASAIRDFDIEKFSVSLETLEQEES